MPNWEYCSIHSKNKVLGGWDFIAEAWAAGGNRQISTLKEGLHPFIARRGCEGWELVLYERRPIEVDNSIRGWFYRVLLRRPLQQDPTRSVPMVKWEYCEVHRQKQAGIIIEKFGTVITHWMPDGTQHTKNSDLADVHSTIARLAQQGWEVVDWQPNPYDKEGGYGLLKRPMQG